MHFVGIAVFNLIFKKTTVVGMIDGWDAISQYFDNSESFLEILIMRIVVLFCILLRC